jgi:polysaccharide export outer membrane protein
MIDQPLRAVRNILLVAALLIIGATATVAQQNSAAQSDTKTPAPEPTLTQVTAEVISPGDLLEITVFNVPDLTQQVRVNNDGKAPLSLIGSTSLAGMTEEVASETVARDLRDQHFLVDPQVRVSIKESATLAVSVLGEVQHPGVYQIVQPRNLLDIISMAGGPTNTADTRITVKHRSHGGGAVTANIKYDDARTAVASDVLVYPGDLVMVPRAGVVYVLGDVARPGGFVMQDDGRITLLQALAQAGSPLSTAAAGKMILIRKNGEGEEYTTTQLNADKIARGKEKDVELQANDIIYMPNSNVKSALRSAAAVSGIAASVGTLAVYGLAH